jgi:hypothetical protein
MKYEKKEWTVEDKRQMDIAAESARTELKTLVGTESEEIRRDTVRDIALWLKKHKSEAGYKRLCKILVATGEQYEGREGE